MVQNPERGITGRESVGVDGREAGLGVHVGFPEADSVGDPAFGHGACAEPEAVSEAFVDVEFGGNAHLRQPLQARLHGATRGDAVGRLRW